MSKIRLTYWLVDLFDLRAVLSLQNGEQAADHALFCLRVNLPSPAVPHIRDIRVQNSSRSVLRSPTSYVALWCWQSACFVLVSLLFLNCTLRTPERCWQFTYQPSFDIRWFLWTNLFVKWQKSRQTDEEHAVYNTTIIQLGIRNRLVLERQPDIWSRVRPGI